MSGRSGNSPERVPELDDGFPKALASRWLWGTLLERLPDPLGAHPTQGCRDRQYASNGGANVRARIDSRSILERAWEVIGMSRWICSCLTSNSRRLGWSREVSEGCLLDVRRYQAAAPSLRLILAQAARHQLRMGINSRINRAPIKPILCCNPSSPPDVSHLPPHTRSVNGRFGLLAKHYAGCAAAR